MTERPASDLPAEGSTPFRIIERRPPPTEALAELVQTSLSLLNALVGDIYGSGARVVLDRKERLDDALAERRKRPAATRAAKAARRTDPSTAAE